MSALRFFPFFVIFLMGCAAGSSDIAGLYVDPNHGESAYLIERNGSGFNVTAVKVEGQRVRERLWIQYVEKSGPNGYKIFTGPEKVNYYELKAGDSCLTGIYRIVTEQALCRAVLTRIDEQQVNSSKRDALK